MGFTALFGGTFNPPHIGHYKMLRALDSRRDIDEVWLMPDRIPPHKVCDFLASDKDRINMCRIMAEMSAATDYIIIDSPPMAMFSDAEMLADKAKIQRA